MIRNKKSSGKKGVKCIDTVNSVFTALIIKRTAAAVLTITIILVIFTIVNIYLVQMGTSSKEGNRAVTGACVQ